MEEKELIARIKKLQNIQPDRAWVLATKAYILGENEEATGRLPAFNFNFFQSQKTAFLMIPAMMAILLIGFFFYNRNTVPNERIVVEPAVLESITNDLKTVESNIAQATADLEKVKEPERVLEIKPMVLSTIENGEKIVSAAKKLVKKPNYQPGQVLTAIDKMENALGEMEETYLDKQKELAGELIKDLKERSLTKEQENLLIEAEKCYNQGDFSGALIKVIEISQKE